MRTQSLYQPHFSQASITVDQTTEASQDDKKNGFISELVYDEHQTAVVQLLVPLLQQLGQQSRWLLWLIPQQKLSKSWLQQAELPVNKIVQLNQISPIATVDAMEKALLTGNYSVVLGWLPDLTEQDRLKLSHAAQWGNAYGFIMRPQRSASHRHYSALKIQSSLYH